MHLGAASARNGSRFMPSSFVIRHSSFVIRHSSFVRPAQRLPRRRESRLRSRPGRVTWPHSTSRLGSRLRRRSRPPGPGWAAARRTTRRRSPGRPRQPRGWSISSCNVHLLSGFHRSAERRAPPTGRVYRPRARQSAASWRNQGQGLSWAKSPPRKGGTPETRAAVSSGEPPRQAGRGSGSNAGPPCAGTRREAAPARKPSGETGPPPLPRSRQGGGQEKRSDPGTIPALAVPRVWTLPRSWAGTPWTARSTGRRASAAARGRTMKNRRPADSSAGSTRGQTLSGQTPGPRAADTVRFPPWPAKAGRAPGRHPPARAGADAGGIEFPSRRYPSCKSRRMQVSGASAGPAVVFAW